jgi:transposase
MNPIIDRCAGLDVHQATVMATVRIPGEAGGRRGVTEQFATTTASLLILRDWLHAHGVTHVALESTGVYWKPVYYVLEDDFSLLLVNAQHVKAVPGRKTDVRDSEWLAQLLECGLLRASLVPPRPIRDLRDLTRYRKQQIRDRAREVNRLHRFLEDAGVKLSTVATDVMGASGRAMLDALLHGTTDPAVVADLAKGKLRKKLPALREALQGQFRAHHALLIGQLLAKVDFLDEMITNLTVEIDRLVVPFEPMLANLDTIPGVDRKGAIAIVAETSGDMTRFETADRLCSWTGICPGHAESAGKRRSGKTRKGNPYLRTTLIESGLAASRAKNTALQACYRRVKRNRGHKKAVVATGHQILRIAFHVMRDGVPYHELGARYLEERQRERTIRRHVRQLENFGYQVLLVEPAA